MTLLPWMTATVNLGLPVMLAANGGLICEKAGTAALFLEGTMLTSAFVAVRTGGGLTGLFLGVLSGCVVTGLHYILVNRLNVKDVIAGVGLNMLALAATSFYERLSPSPESVTTLSNTAGTLIGLISVFGLAMAMRNPRWRLFLELTGESERQARIFGINTSLVHLFAHLGAGIMAGLGGALLPLMGIGTFVENMTNGRGYLALAAIVFGRWQLVTVIAAALGFAALDALQLVAATQGIHADPDILALLPYTAGLIALLLRKSSNTGPAELSRAN
jgi:simple sugar transport system permease protein